LTHSSGQLQLFQSTAPSESRPAITIWRPFSALIYAGKKTFECRSWAPRNLAGVRLGIHAAARVASKSDVTAREREAIELALELPQARWGELPGGGILCTVVVSGLYRITEVRAGWALVGDVRPNSRPARRLWIGEEQLFGTFEPGVWIWHFQDRRQVNFTPYSGRQGIWTAQC